MKIFSILILLLLSFNIQAQTNTVRCYDTASYTLCIDMKTGQQTKIFKLVS